MAAHIPFLPRCAMPLNKWKVKPFRRQNTNLSVQVKNNQPPLHEEAHPIFPLLMKMRGMVPSCTRLLRNLLHFWSLFLEDISTVYLHSNSRAAVLNFQIYAEI